MDELEHFKRDIGLHEYAASIGYELDQRESSRLEVVMRRGPDKISVRKDADGHYVYYSFRDEEDNGTIIDFVARRQTKNFGEIRKLLRVFKGSDGLKVFQSLDPAPRFDRAAMLREFRGMRPLLRHQWLEGERRIPRPVLAAPRFKDVLMVDGRANAIFPHYDAEGLCGFEKRNKNFKGFAALGKKGLWLSAQFPTDRRLVVGESAIDCLSYEALFPDTDARYASLAGGLNPEQPELLLKACREVPAGSEIVCITHPDADGDRYAEAIAEAASRASLPFLIDRPDGVKDWNDFLRAAGLGSFPAVHREPCK